MYLMQALGPVLAGDDATKARTLHLAEGVLVALRRKTPDAVIGELVDAARQAGLSPYVLAAAVVAVAAGDAATTGIQQQAVATARRLWGTGLPLTESDDAAAVNAPSA